MEPAKNLKYRKDIDGLRSIAVLSVILFHLGYLPNGYLGVDIFFAISGYLITKIVYDEAIENRFSIVNFYLRRIRRIIPLIFFTSLVVLIVGIIVMLPEDLKNLSETVFATNFFANNICMLITSGDYWDVANEYKPMMHTWSLGVEEQFYIVFPVIFLICNGKRSKFILPILCVLTLLSLFFFCLSTDETSKFFLIQYRFFELSLGGLGAIFFKDKIINTKYTFILSLTVLAFLGFDIPLNADLKLLLVLFATIGLLIVGGDRSKISLFLVQNKIMLHIGKISFSLYMWHQIVLAFARYFVLEKIGIVSSIVLFIIILLLSWLSYYLIEQPFRDKKRVGTKTLLLLLSGFFIVIITSSVFLYVNGGVTRNVPELDLYAKDNTYNISPRRQNIHVAYNSRINDLNKGFSNKNTLKVFVIGNSRARDFCNLLIELNIDNLEISYVQDLYSCKDFQERLDQSNLIFFTNFTKEDYEKVKRKFRLEKEKVWSVALLNKFGSSNGIFYNKKGSNYLSQRTEITQNTIEKINDLKVFWGDRNINILASVIDKDGTVPVFTPDGKFISPDCIHFTQAGAKYYAEKVNIKNILKVE